MASEGSVYESAYEESECGSADDVDMLREEGGAFREGSRDSGMDSPSQEDSSVEAMRFEGAFPAGIGVGYNPREYVYENEDSDENMNKDVDFEMNENMDDKMDEYREEAEDEEETSASAEDEGSEDHLEERHSDREVATTREGSGSPVPDSASEEEDQVRVHGYGHYASSQEQLRTFGYGDNREGPPRIGDAGTASLRVNAHLQLEQRRGGAGVALVEPLSEAALRGPAGEEAKSGERVSTAHPPVPSPAGVSFRFRGFGIHLS